MRISTNLKPHPGDLIISELVKRVGKHSNTVDIKVDELHQDYLSCITLLKRHDKNLISPIYTHNDYCNILNISQILTLRRTDLIYLVLSELSRINS